MAAPTTQRRSCGDPFMPPIIAVQTCRMERLGGRPGVHLLRTEDRVGEVEAFVARLGGRVGLRGVLADLDRSATPARVPARAVDWGFRWDREDTWSSRWWPQGISSCADAWDVDHVDGCSVLVTSSYSKSVDDIAMGSRLTFVDVRNRDAIRYRRVLLVEPYFRDGGQ